MVLTALYGWLCPATDSTERPALRWSHAALGAAAALVVAIVLYTSFFTNLRGPLDAVLTYLPWLNRAGGASPNICRSAIMTVNAPFTPAIPSLASDSLNNSGLSPG